ncbi:hypothetical protein [Microcoleus sp. K5-D4]
MTSTTARLREGISQTGCNSVSRIGKSAIGQACSRYRHRNRFSGDCGRCT